MLGMVRVGTSKYRHPFILKYIFTDNGTTYRHYSDLSLILHRIDDESFKGVSCLFLFKRLGRSGNELLIKAEQKEKFLERLREIMEMSA